jgi:two-component sensor histidine kinase
MPTPTSHFEDPGLGLALAMVVSSTAPLLLLDGELNIVACSASFCRAFEIDPATAQGAQLFALGKGEWNVPQLRSLMAATLSGDADIDAYEMDLQRGSLKSSRRLVVNVQKLAYGSPDTVRLLVAVADVTEARLSEKRSQELLRENEVLIQEVRHRVANSLQIIASVLMQNARRSQSPETRGHLQDAHRRVMSVADLQQQLAASTLGTVHLGAYLAKLCDSISASMIADPEELVLEVVGEDAVVDAGVSVSLGLVVTELVINALKHGFPDGRAGRISVDYRTAGPGWTLSVSDTGVGMAAAGGAAAAGLGTSIIQALAKQLAARVEVEDAGPGTRVSLIHEAVTSANPTPSTVAA